MAKPYDWKEIEQFLLKELKETKHILTFGTIGSLNVEHDIDMIITKNPKSKSSDFYKEIHKIFDSVDSYLNKKYKAKLIRAAHSSYTLEFMKLSGYEKNDLVFHVMTYTTYSALKRNWGWALFPDENMKEILSENYDCLLGSVNDLYSKEFQKGKYGDNILIYLSTYDRTNSHYSDNFLLKVMNHYFDFLMRKRLKVKAKKAMNKKEVREIFYEICDIDDELNKKND